jgi:hypothetical protein
MSRAGGGGGDRGRRRRRFWDRFTIGAGWVPLMVHCEVSDAGVARKEGGGSVPDRRWEKPLGKGERIPVIRVRGTSFCSSRCNMCWSSKSVYFPQILRNRMGIEHLLETV